MAPGLELCIRCVEAPGRALARCTARMDYAYPWMDLIARFKFQEQPAWAGTLAALMAETSEAQQLLAQADLLAPIPLSAARLRERGFNQAWELVRQLKRHAPGQPGTLPDLLLRAETEHLQHTLPRNERFTHARAALRANPKHSHHLQQAHVLLVDDVMTTGATLEAAAHTLLAAGAATVSAMVFARTPPPPDHGQLHQTSDME